MLRKTLIALAATATVGAAALAPTSASAKGWHHHHHFFGPGLGINLVGPSYVDDGCYRVKKVFWRHGHLRVRYITVCG